MVVRGHWLILCIIIIILWSYNSTNHYADNDNWNDQNLFVSSFSTYSLLTPSKQRYNNNIQKRILLQTFKNKPFLRSCTVQVSPLLPRARTKLTTRISKNDNDSNITKSSSSSSTQQQHVIVVGGGVGGLAIAARLVSSKSVVPIHVTILEKNSNVGGRCGSFDIILPNRINTTTSSSSNLNENEVDTDNILTFRHEHGPSLLLLPQMYQQLFIDVTKSTKSMNDFGLYIQQCIPAYTVVFDDGDTINIGFPKNESTTTSTTTISPTPTIDEINDVESTLQHKHYHQLYLESREQMNRFEKDGAKKWDEYMKLCRAYLECGIPNFIEEQINLSSLPNFIYESIFKNFGQSFPLKSHRSVLETYFQSEKMCALASFQDLYVGLQPFDTNIDDRSSSTHQSTAPAVFGLLSAIELHPNIGGVYAPIGGFRSVQESLYKLVTEYCSNHVTIQCNCTVVRVTNDGVYYSCNNNNDTTFSRTTNQNVQTNELQFLKADAIVINADLPYAEQSIVQTTQKSSNHISESVQQNHGVGLNKSLAKELQNDSYEVKYDWDDRKYRYSSGVIAFHWSINRSIDELNTHTVFLSATNRTVAYQSWEYVRNSTASTSFMLNNKNEPFNFYVHRATKTDPTAAPKVSVVKF
jgi:hypothetical protein